MSTYVSELVRFPKELALTVAEDCRKNKGMWLAYAFLAAGILVAVAVCVIMFWSTFEAMHVLSGMDKQFFVDNPTPLFVWAFILYATYRITLNVHQMYIEIRKVIKKGNR